MERSDMPPFLFRCPNTAFAFKAL